MRVWRALGGVVAVSICAAAVGHGDKGGLGPAPAGTSGFAFENILLRSRVALQDFGGATQGNDCWGYVSPSGREYALMGMNTMTGVVEITDPLNPIVVETIPHPTSVWSDIKTYDEYAYVVTDGVGAGLQVLDLTDVDSGVVTLAATVADQGFNWAHNVAVDSVGGRLYTLGSNLPSDGLVAWSLQDPANPTIVGAYGMGGYVHDAHIVTMSDGPWAGREIAFCFIEDRGIEIVDVTNESGMQRLSLMTYSGIAYSHQGWFDASTNLLYQNDELDEINFGGTTRTRVWDVSDLTNPTLVNTFGAGVTAIDHNLYTRDGFIYEANYRSGLRIFDARSNPTDPVEVGWFDTYAADDAAEFNGAWSVYPYFPSGNVIISDIEGGLFVVDPSYALNGGTPLEYAFPDGLPEVVPPAGQTVRVQITGANGFSVAAGTPVLHVLDDGVKTDAPMTQVGPDLYEASLPARDCGEELVYWFGADASNGLHVHSPLIAPLEAYTAPVGEDPLVGFADTFETNEGWTAGAPGDTASSGIWTRVDPIGTGAQPEDDSDDPGALCFITGNASPGAGIGTNDVDGGVTTLVSPRLNGVGGAFSIVRASVWWSNDLGGNPGEDSMLIEISNDDGATWTLLEEVTTSTGAWAPKSWRLDEVVVPTDEMRLRFIARDEGGGSIVEAGVDDFELVTLSCAGGEDLNGDGVVDGADLGLLLGEWGGPGAGDLNGDGTVDGADLGLLLGAWG